MVEIIEYNSISNKENYEEFLKLKKNNLLYDNEFINILIEIYDVKFFFATSFDHSKQINGLLLFYINKDFRNKLNAFTFNDCLIADDKNIIENLINETQSFILKNNISSFTLNTNEKLKNLNFKVKTNYILNIIPNNEELNWKNKPGVFRTEVRKANKRNFIVEKKTTFPILEYYKLYLKNQIKKKIPIHDYNFFSKLFEIKSIEVFSCFKDNSLAGYAIICIKNKNAYLLFSNISDKQLSHGVNQLIYWKIIDYLSKIDCTSFILGPSNKDGKTAFFKKKVGGDECIFYEYKFGDLKKKSFNHKKKQSILKKIFYFIYQRLPKFLLKIILKKKRYYEKIY